MFQFFSNLFKLLNSIIDRFFGISERALDIVDDGTKVLAVGAAQLHHEACSGMAEGLKAVTDREAARKARMESLAPPAP